MKEVEENDGDACGAVGDCHREGIASIAYCWVELDEVLRPIHRMGELVIEELGADARGGNAHLQPSFFLSLLGRVCLPVHVGFAAVEHGPVDGLVDRSLVAKTHLVRELAVASEIARPPDNTTRRSESSRGWHNQRSGHELR